MTKPVMTCSFCGAEQSLEHPLIAGQEARICDACTELAHKVVTSWGRRREEPVMTEPLPRPRDLKDRLDDYVIGQDIAKEILSVSVYNHYKRFHFECNELSLHGPELDDTELQKSNVLLVGPSGTGKTLLASTLARLVGVPFVSVDATTFTQAGYVGEDVESILVRLIDAAGGNIGRAEWGMVYIDEIDKLARAPELGSASRDVSGEGVQQALLKLVEGGEVKVSLDGRRGGNEKKTSIDTRNILFIAGGAFAGIEDRLIKRLGLTSSGIGFGATVVTPDKVPAGETLLKEVRPTDLRQFGLIPEFIGRFPVLAPLEPLDEDALVTILTEPKNALVKQYRRLFSYDDIELDFTEEALRALARQAIEQGTGARGLRSVLEHLLRRPMFELPSSGNGGICRVIKDASDEATENDVTTEFEPGAASVVTSNDLSEEGDADDGLIEGRV